MATGFVEPDLLVKVNFEALGDAVERYFTMPELPLNADQTVVVARLVVQSIA